MNWTLLIPKRVILKTMHMLLNVVLKVLVSTKTTRKERNKFHRKMCPCSQQPKNGEEIHKVKCQGNKLHSTRDVPPTLVEIKVIWRTNYQL